MRRAPGSSEPPRAVRRAPRARCGQGRRGAGGVFCGRGTPAACVGLGSERESRDARATREEKKVQYCSYADSRSREIERDLRYCNMYMWLLVV